MAQAAQDYWIQHAIKHPNALHDMLGIPRNQDIPDDILTKSAKKPGLLGARARLALRLKGMSNKNVIN